MSDFHDDDDEDCTCEEEVRPLETYRLIAITTGLFAAIANNISSFWGLMTEEFQANSNWRADNRERLEAAEELRQLVEGDGS